MPNVLITAGPTRESIDPIRYISNRSSGKMGYAIAKAFAAKGAKVRLVSGPVSNELMSQVKLINQKDKVIAIIGVETAEEMRKAVLREFKWSDIVIMAAAVADYKTKEVVAQKIKKTDSDFSLKLEKTSDILKELGRKKRANQILVGFALETKDLIKNAKKKLIEKNLDLIIANTIENLNADCVNVVLIDKSRQEAIKAISKEEFARLLVKKLALKL